MLFSEVPLSSSSRDPPKRNTIVFNLLTKISLTRKIKVLSQQRKLKIKHHPQSIESTEHLVLGHCVFFTPIHSSQKSFTPSKLPALLQPIPSISRLCQFLTPIRLLDTPLLLMPACPQINAGVLLLHLSRHKDSSLQRRKRNSLCPIQNQRTKHKCDLFGGAGRVSLRNRKIIKFPKSLGSTGYVQNILFTER